MAEWKNIKISDIGTVMTGNTPPRKSPELYGHHTIFIKPTDISEESKYTYKPEECYSELGFIKYKKSLIPKGSTCVVTIGSIGKKITKAHTDCFINQAMNAVIPNEEFDQEFVYYVLKYNLNQLKVLDSGTASGRENVSKSSFSNIKIDIPINKKVQKKIGSILSAYDDLIENNLKRIKLLEELAQRTYEEWFVKFTINGEKLPINEETGLPEGWEKKKLGDMVDFKYGKMPESKLIQENGYPIFSGYRITGYYPKFTIDEPAIIIVARGVGGTGDVKLSPRRCWLTNLSIEIQPKLKGDVLKYFLFFKLKNEKMRSLDSGAAQSQITITSLLNYQILVPSLNLQSLFDSFYANIYNQIENLQSQNRLLKEARDILLPRLMNRTIEVDSLPNISETIENNKELLLK